VNQPAPHDTLGRWLAAPGHIRIARDAADYPALLGAIDDPPEWLYVRGDAAVLHLPCLAIVGSRNPTRGGEQNAYEFARYLGRHGFCIVSGLAAGIDAAAHRGALAAGAATVAFLGHGIDTVYPARHRELADEIASRGALVSEFPLGTPPMKPLFPQRNRLISGLSLGTVVVEAARQSGSLITARLAAEQGREVFALPGSIHNPMARGCHRLIRDGAKLVESAEDIVNELGALAGGVLQFSEQAPEPAGGPLAGEDAGYRSLHAVLGHDPVSIDELASRSGLTIDELSSMLLILELSGKVEKLSGGRYALLS
jgi:DNA processing protein